MKDSDPNRMPEGNRIVRITHRFEGPPEPIFDAWLDPQMIGRWMFGPSLRGEEILHLMVDPREGGTFSFKVLRQGQEIDHVGTYLELKRPHRLKFTWGVVGESAGESVVTADIAPKAPGTELNLTHEMDPEWAAYTKRTEEAWTKMLNALDKALSEHSADRK
jgi:uncharacterized protein YndB with AHSA1/START domain